MQGNIDSRYRTPKERSLVREERLWKVKGIFHYHWSCNFQMMRQFSTRTVVAVLLLITAWMSGTLWADTIGYWRHEEGSEGGFIPAGPDTVFDDSSYGNHMQTYDPTFTSATYSSTVSPLILRSGLLNTLSLNFGPGGDDEGKNDDNYTQGKLIQTYLFTELTIEPPHSVAVAMAAAAERGSIAVLIPASGGL